MSIKNTNTVFDLADIFSQVHGYRPAYVAGLPVSSPGMPQAIVPSSIKKVTNMHGIPLYGQSDLIGREVFCPLTFLGVDAYGKPKDYNFPYAVIGFCRTKTIISTEMTELNGSVDEVISNRDWEISIKGFLIGQFEQFPDTELKELNDLFEFNHTCRLQSAVSDIFLHTNDTILIKRIDIPEKPRVVGVRDFSIQAKSSSIFTLYQA